MREIFDLQWKLNVATLERIGLDYEETIRHAEHRPTWINNYRQAFSAELAELVREVQAHGMGTQNAKIELVDMLHFLVSLSHIVEISADEASIPDAPADGFDLHQWVTRIFLALDDLQNSLKWKWWARGGGYKPERAREAVLALWKCFGDGCGHFGLGLQTLKKIYIAKNELNFRRQDQGYDEDTKTEDDNRTLLP